MLTSLISSGTRRACVLALAAALAACGGGGAEDTPNVGNPPAPPTVPAGTGQLHSATLLGTIPAVDIAAALSSEESLA